MFAYTPCVRTGAVAKTRFAPAQPGPVTSTIVATARDVISDAHSQSRPFARTCHPKVMSATASSVYAGAAMRGVVPDVSQATKIATGTEARYR